MKTNQIKLGNIYLYLLSDNAVFLKTGYKMVKTVQVDGFHFFQEICHALIDSTCSLLLPTSLSLQGFDGDTFILITSPWYSAQRKKILTTASEARKAGFGFHCLFQCLCWFLSFKIMLRMSELFLISNNFSSYKILIFILTLQRITSDDLLIFFKVFKIFSWKNLLVLYIVKLYWTWSPSLSSCFPI